MTISSVTVAVVDDDPAIRKAIARLLACVGVGVRAYASAEDFLEAFPSERFDCAIIDLQLPGISGFELRSRMVDDAIELPVIFVSAFDDRIVESRAAHLGAIAFLHKPFDGGALIAAVEAATGRVLRLAL
jgi:FixJ family two-component response regulator